MYNLRRHTSHLGFPGLIRFFWGGTRTQPVMWQKYQKDLAADHLAADHLAILRKVQK